jgi:hypothetical protein
MLGLENLVFPELNHERMQMVVVETKVTAVKHKSPVRDAASVLQWPVALSGDKKLKSPLKFRP